MIGLPGLGRVAGALQPILGEDEDKLVEELSQQEPPHAFQHHLAQLGRCERLGRYFLLAA